MEAPPTITSSHHGDGEIPARNTNGTQSAKAGVVSKEGAIAATDEVEMSEVMKPPSLPPPSKIKEPSAATMPPPPSLPPRFVSGV